MIDTLTPGRIVVVGDLLLDRYITGSVNRISPEAPVPVLLHAREHATPGGAANVAANAAALGAPVSLIGVVGTDAAARTLRTTLAAWPGIDTTGWVADPAWTTITKTRILGGQQQIIRIDEEILTPFSAETNARLLAAVDAALPGARVLVCSDYAKGVLSDEVIRGIMARAAAASVPVIVDPKRATFGIYTGAALITPNRAEISRATFLPTDTDAQVEAAARAASSQFGGDVLVTRSEQGMSLWQRGGSVRHVSAQRSEVFDVCGAGDTVVATIATMLSAGLPLETAVVIATTAAAISVSKHGTATVSRHELQHALNGETTGHGNLVSLGEATRIVADWRRHGARIVFTNGCFDLLHPGHIALLRGAARQGDRLVVALNTDRSVAALKGPSRPVQDEQARATVLGALRDVDLVVLFDEETPIKAIEALRPDVLVKGADYTEDQVVGAPFVRSYGGRVALIDLIDGRSTTSLVRRAGAGQANG
ncbi:D-glycero-beta-D-manno-heptose 1-phosphate adenylyltransferase [Komagataeibacter xylinus]|uniref:D-glycero-beta-D-manno-heptose 1-phosphate adenylyltransferase n=1 Tax=Komagataeibacter xylinus TaxID=28448 RepID=UPI00280AB9E0|nr:D-glycero-beta-D-manno-heptose 1-phosphate adenylyltransferase [Komagataeibacter xylinus]